MKWTLCLMLVFCSVSAQQNDTSTSEHIQKELISTKTTSIAGTTETITTPTSTEGPPILENVPIQTAENATKKVVPRMDPDLEWACSNSRPVELTRPGSFTSPPDPDKNNGYAYNAHCSWVLTAPLGQVIRLEFDQFDLEPTYLCAYGNVTVHDGYGVGSDDQIERFCGTQLPPVVHSSSHQMRVTFKSGHSGSGEGIHANFDFRPMQEIACKEPPAVLDWNIGGIVSPNYPNSYPAGLQCTWRLEPTQEIRLEFDQWTLNSDCRDANVTVYIGPSPDPDYLLATLCGSPKPQPVGTTAESLLLVFKSQQPGLNKAYFRARFNGHNITEWACGNSKPAELDWAPGYIISPSTEISLCRWRFTAPVGKVIRLEIDHFDLSECSNCGCAGLSFYDGENEYAPLLGEYCGSGWDTSFIISGGNKAYLLYQSYMLNPNTGFKVRYSFYDIAEHACGTDRPITLTEGRGLITSPGYGTPTGYPNNVDCQWQILAKETQVVRMDFLDFGVEYCPGCQCDRLSVYNGPSLHANLVRHLCDFARPLPLTTAVNSSYLRFTTDRDQTAKGFRIQYQFEILADLACGISRPATMNVDPGYVFSPNYGDEHGYPPDSYCEWLVSAPAGYIIQLSFQFMDIEFGYFCEFDYLSVHDGVSTNAPLLKRLCGKEIPSNITSTGDAMMLAFTTNGALEKLGFKASYIFKRKQQSDLTTLIPAIACGIFGFLTLVLIVVVCCKIPQRIKRRLTGDRPHEVRDQGANPPPYSATAAHRSSAQQMSGDRPSNAEISCPPAFGIGREQYTRIAAYPPPTYEESFWDISHSSSGNFPLHDMNEQPPGYEEGLNTLQREALRQEGMSQEQEVVRGQEVQETPLHEPADEIMESSASDVSVIQPRVSQPIVARMPVLAQQNVNLAGAGALVTADMPRYSGETPRLSSEPDQDSYCSSHLDSGANNTSQTNLLRSNMQPTAGTQGTANAAYYSSQEDVGPSLQGQVHSRRSRPQEQDSQRERAHSVAAILQGRSRTNNKRIIIPPDDRSSIRKSLSKSEPDILESLGYKSKNPRSSYLKDPELTDAKIKGEHSASTSMLHKLSDKDFTPRLQQSGARLTLAASNVPDSVV